MNMSNKSSNSRVGAGAAARKRDRYTAKMNAIHPPRLGREAMDAKYLDPLYDRVLALSEHLSIHYGDYTVNEIRTLVCLAAENHAAPVLQKYWDEIDGVIQIGESSTPVEEVSAPYIQQVESNSSSVVYSSSNEEVLDLDSTSIVLTMQENQDSVIEVESSSTDLIERDLGLESAESSHCQPMLCSDFGSDHEAASECLTLIDVHQSSVSADAPIPPLRKKSARGVNLRSSDAPADIVLSTNAIISDSVLLPFQMTMSASPVLSGVQSSDAYSRKRTQAVRLVSNAKYCQCLWRFLNREMPCSVRAGRWMVAVALLALLSVCCYAPFQ